MSKLFFFFFLGIFVMGIVPSLAQNSDGSLNLITSPLPINLIVEPESTTSAQLKIKNGGNQPEELQVGIMKFSAYGDEGNPKLAEREVGDDYFDWVTFSEKEFILNPGEWKTITAYFTVPKSASFGYYYAITFQRKNPNIADGVRSTKVIGATSCLILLEARVPDAIRDVEVLEFSTAKKIYEFLPTNFFIKLKNKGNVHLAPRGNIFIDRGPTKDVAILSINEQKGNILPNSNRIFANSWNDGFPVYQNKVNENKVITDSHGIPIQELKWDFSTITKLRWGKYTANMLLVYDNGQRDVPIEAKLSFWVIPWRLLGGGLMIVLLLSTGLYSILNIPIKKVWNKISKR